MWQQLFDGLAHRQCADDQRLVAPTTVEQTIGKDVAAIEVRAQLDFIDRDEADIDVAWHRLDGRDPIARTRRLDLLRVLAHEANRGRAKAGGLQDTSDHTNGARAVRSVCGIR